jgi:5-methyltetrahydropteroyltriglutamate--homocysteine methyltransferase
MDPEEGPATLTYTIDTDVTEGDLYRSGTQIDDGGTFTQQDWRPDDPPEAYPDLDGFLEDVARVLREEVVELTRLGARYLQLDAPHYPLLRDEETAPWYEALGWERDVWLERSVALENRVMEAAEAITWGLHTCRGNQDSRWLATGDYAPLADAVFGGTRADRLLLEYDDARAGGFEPLRAVPAAKMVVLGLVTTKRSATADPDTLAGRVEAAAEHVPLERLAVSPQCGFGTSVVGNRIGREDQLRKIEAVVETARRVWGGVG